jgi:hypothetical protein
MVITQFLDCGVQLNLQNSKNKMRLQEIISQLKAVIPRYTNAFTTNIAVNSLTRAANIVTVETDIDHGLSVGDKILINGAKIPIAIESLTSFGKFALAITTQQHNLTRINKETEIIGAIEVGYNGVKKLVWDSPVVDIEAITIDGNLATVTTKTNHGLSNNSKLRIDVFGASQNVYNQSNFQVSSIIDATKFTYTVYGANSPASPNSINNKIQMRIVLNSNVFMFEVVEGLGSPATGSVFQLSLYKNGYNGYKTILSVPTLDRFTYSIDSTPLSPAQGSIIAQSNPCIEGSIDLSLCQRHFESKNSGNSQNWIYVILDDENASKNTRTKGDSMSYGEDGISIREESFQNVNIYIFLPFGANTGNNELMPTNIRDLGYSFKPIIYKALLGFTPSSELSQSKYSQLLPVTNGVDAFNGTYLIYKYIMQATSWTNSCDAIEGEDVFAFKEFDFDVLDSFGYNESVMKIQGRVDE